MTYPALIQRYSTQRAQRGQQVTLQTIGGQALKIDTTAVTGEAITLEHLLTWAQYRTLFEYYNDNVEATFNLTIDGDTISVRFTAPPQILRKRGSYYVVQSNVGRVL